MLNHFLGEAEHLIKTKEAKDSVFVIAGRIATTLAGFFAMLFVARYFGPYAFGVFSVFYAIISNFVYFFEQSFNVMLIHFYNRKSYNKDLVLKVLFKIRFFLMVVLCLLGYLGADFIANSVLNKPELVFAIKMSFIVSFIASLVLFYLSVFNAQEKFVRYSSVRFIYLGGASLILLFFVFSDKLNLSNSMYVYVVTGVLSLIISFFLVSRRFFSYRGRESSFFRKLIDFGKWTFCSVIMMVLSKDLLMFMLARFASIEDVGKFSLANQFSMGIFTVLSSFSIVLFVSSSKLASPDRVKSFVKKSFAVLFVIVVGIFLALLLFASFFIDLFFGKKYGDVASILLVLFLAHSLLILLFPIRSVLVNFFEKVKLLFFIDCLYFVISFVTYFIVLPLCGVMGGVIAFLAVNIFYFIIIFLFYLFAVKNLKKGKKDGKRKN